MSNFDIDRRNGGARRRSHEKEKQLDLDVFDGYIMRSRQNKRRKGTWQIFVPNKTKKKENERNEFSC